MKRYTICFKLLVLMVALGVFFSAPVSAADNASTITKVTIATDPTAPPFIDKKNGELGGFDIELIRAIAKAENLDLSFREMPFNGIVPSLEAGSVDASIAAISVTAERAKSIDYTDAYLLSGLSILVRKDSPIHSFDDLDGHVVAAKKSTTGASYLKKHGIKEGNIKQYQNTAAAYQALLTGGVDAVIYDNSFNAAFANNQPKLDIAGPMLTGEYYAIAVSKKADPKLIAIFNDGLKAVRENGSYEKLVKKYFGAENNGIVTKVISPEEAIKQ